MVQSAEIVISINEILIKITKIYNNFDFFIYQAIAFWVIPDIMVYNDNDYILIISFQDIHTNEKIDIRLYFCSNFECKNFKRLHMHFKIQIMFGLLWTFFFY